MNNKRIHLFFFLVTLLFCSCISVDKWNATLAKKHDPEHLKKDVNTTYTLLTKGHPGVNWYISEEALEYKFDSLKSSITTPLTSKEFYRKLAPVVAEIKCGHTRLLLSAKKLTKKEKDSLALLTKPLQQVTYKVVDGRLYIVSLKERLATLKKGDEVVMMNGKPVSTVISDITSSFASDGYNKTFKDAVLNRAFVNWYATVYDNPDTLSLKIKSIDTMFNVQLTTSKKTSVKKETIAKKKVVKDSVDVKRSLAKEKKRQRYRGLDEMKKPLLELRFLNNDSSIAYLKVKSFSFPYADFNKFYRESFAEIKRAGVKQLILDLRDNGGGSLTACRNLFAYLTDKKFTYLQKVELERNFVPYWHIPGIENLLMGAAFYLSSSAQLRKTENESYKIAYKGSSPLPNRAAHYNGELFVLINGYSFSAAALLSANIKANNRAIFVGQETGGGFNGCVAGRIPVLSLPQSKLKLRMGLYPVLPNAHDTKVGRGIFPDYEVKATLADLLAGKDVEMNWVLNHIKDKTNL